MRVVANRRIAVALVVGAALSGWSATSPAAEADVGAAAPTPLTQELIGLELTPLSLALASCCDYHGGSLDRFQAGLGGAIRLLRHRWQYAYVTPIAAGAYLSSGNDTILVHIQAEGGVIVPRTDRRLELGLGVGIGALAMRYANTCDGRCNLGGAGFLISFAARFLFVVRPTLTAGASARLVIPMSQPREEVWGHNTGHGNMLLGGLEVAFGRH
jgi:hypothetical protein